MSTVYSRKLSDEEMRRAFKCFDKDNSGRLNSLKWNFRIHLYFCFQGFITREELRDVLKQLNQNISERRITEVLKTVDENGDGKISYEEFAVMLQES